MILQGDLLGDRGAEFSSCGTYRYSLWRRWGDGPRMLIVGLNPSTADATVDDPTIVKCIGFARREGCGGLTMANLFAYRATDPQRMKAAADPIGPGNDAWLAALAAEHALRVAAWGTHATHLNRERDVLDRHLLGGLMCFGTTKNGHPRHPLYLRGNTPLEAFGW